MFLYKHIRILLPLALWLNITSAFAEINVRINDINSQVRPTDSFAVSVQSDIALKQIETFLPQLINNCFEKTVQDESEAKTFNNELKKAGFNDVFIVKGNSLTVKPPFPKIDFSVDFSKFKVGNSNFNLGISNLNLGISFFKVDFSNFRVGISNFKVDFSNFKVGISKFNLGISNFNLGISTFKVGKINF